MRSPVPIDPGDFVVAQLGEVELRRAQVTHLPTHHVWPLLDAMTVPGPVRHDARARGGRGVYVERYGGHLRLFLFEQGGGAGRLPYAVPPEVEEFPPQDAAPLCSSARDYIELTAGGAELVLLDDDVPAVAGIDPADFAQRHRAAVGIVPPPIQEA